jgi:hypothetical protein
LPNSLELGESQISTQADVLNEVLGVLTPASETDGGAIEGLEMRAYDRLESLLARVRHGRLVTAATY